MCSEIGRYTTSIPYGYILLSVESITKAFRPRPWARKPKNTPEGVLFCARGGDRTRTAVRPQNFKSCVATNYTTRAGSALLVHHTEQCAVLEAETGIEPVHGGFADLSVTTSPLGHVEWDYSTRQECMPLVLFFTFYVPYNSIDVLSMALAVID